jgi:hypothetical protein
MPPGTAKPYPGLLPKIYNLLTPSFRHVVSGRVRHAHREISLGQKFIVRMAQPATKKIYMNTGTASATKNPAHMYTAHSLQSPCEHCKDRRVRHAQHQSKA